MPPNCSEPSESLLPSAPRVTLQKTVSVEYTLEEDQPDTSCSYISYGIADAIFTSFVVAPQVVSVWRGTWGLMEMHPDLFPHAQTFILGIILHVCFAVLRTHLLSRSVTPPDQRASPGKWLRERILSRGYTYIFTLANIMHWRGGWGLLDTVVAYIIPDDRDPHRPVVIAAFAALFYLTAVGLRSSRNFLASPYFLVTDGKEPTYIFSTRFNTSVCVRLPRRTTRRRHRAGRGDNTIRGRHCVWGSAANTRSPSAMRGSTAGLADTLAGGSRAYSALLECADAIFASVVVAPAVVTYWQSTWTLLDLYLLPEDGVASAAVCAALGLTWSFLLCVFQTRLAKGLDPDRSRIKYLVLSRLYTCLAGTACVAAWRGVWNLLNECTGSSARTLLSTTAAATLSLAALRATRNICAAPFAVAVDSPQDYFDVPTMFRTNSRETALYVLDCIFSVGVVGSLVVFVWRGSWALLDIFLYPEDTVKSCWISLIAGYSIVVVTFALQAPVRWAAARLHGAPRLLLADVYHLVSFVATVNVWRGIWGLLDAYFFPETPKLSNWCSHIISLSLLILLNCSNSILVRGVYIDAEEPAGECVVFPCHYLRLYFHKERTKKRHKRALAAAATASKKPEDASVPLQIPEEKV